VCGLIHQKLKWKVTLSRDGKGTQLPSMIKLNGNYLGGDPVIRVWN
jgi:hypothetical protein